MAPKSGSARRSGAGSRFSLRRLIVTIHLILGLSAGLLLSLTGLSGSILVFRHEIDRWLEPGLRQVSPQQTGLVSLEQVVMAATQEMPGSTVQQIFLAENTGDSHELWLRGTDRRLYIDPYTARVLGGKQETETFTGWLFSWHTKLLSGEAGERIVGWGGVILLLLSVSGVILWWPDRLRQVPDRLRIKWGASGKRVTYDLHRTGGFYAAAALALLAPVMYDARSLTRKAQAFPISSALP